MLKLVKMWLKAPIEERDEGKRRMTGGEAQSGARRKAASSARCSPTSTCIVFFGRGGTKKGQEFRARLINYADDFVILSRGHAAEELAWTRWAMTHRANPQRDQDEHPRRSRSLRLPRVYLRARSLSEGRPLVSGGEAVEEEHPARQGRRGAEFFKGPK